jgi:glucose/arabinose dehydrogenase
MRSISFLRTYPLKYLLAILSLSLCLTFVFAQEPELPPCGERDFIAEFPRVISNLWCIENPLGVGEAGEWAYTALAFTGDGNFYATRPQTGELLLLQDENSDALVDSAEPVASGMRFPNGLAVDGNTLYIIGDGAVYRYANRELSTLVDDLPGGRGFMASAITVYNERLYIGIPFPCDFCEVDNELYGTILSMDLEGQNRQIEARGLRYPAGLLIRDNIVWLTDTARDDLPEGIYDEINRFDLRAETIPHFGFPYCIGLENEPDGLSNFDCNSAQRPQWGFFGGTTPFSLKAYESETFPWLQGKILVTLAGSFDNSNTHGYALIALEEQGAEQAQTEVILPADERITGRQIYPSIGRIISLPSSELLNRRGAGNWPHRVYDLAVSPEGWLYLSVGGEGIYVLRSGNFSSEEICEQLREC